MFSDLRALPSATPRGGRRQRRRRDRRPEFSLYGKTPPQGSPALQSDAAEAESELGPATRFASLAGCWSCFGARPVGARRFLSLVLQTGLSPAKLESRLPFGSAGKPLLRPASASEADGPSAAGGKSAPGRIF